MFTPSAEIDLGDAIYSFSLASPFAPIRFTERAPGGDFWRTALALDQLSRSDLRALLYTACPDICADEVGRLMLPENEEIVLAALKEAVEIAIGSMQTSRYTN
jgi:hypothetical protein